MVIEKDSYIHFPQKYAQKIGFANSVRKSFFFLYWQEFKGDSEWHVWLGSIKIWLAPSQWVGWGVTSVVPTVSSWLEE